MQKKTTTKKETTNPYQHLIDAREKARKGMNLNSAKQFEWLNENSRKFLAAGYLGDGLSAEERIANIAKLSLIHI